MKEVREREREVGAPHLEVCGIGGLVEVAGGERAAHGHPAGTDVVVLTEELQPPGLQEGGHGGVGEMIECENESVCA
jgi:hypothetical protein